MRIGNKIVVHYGQVGKIAASTHICHFMQFGVQLTGIATKQHAFPKGVDVSDLL
jgi:hypothetical protein